MGLALDRLPELYRTTLLLRFADGLSYAEIAAATGVSIGTVMSRLFNGRRKLAGSLIGGLPETQEMLDFCAEHGIVCDIEMLDIRKINEAYERMQRGDVRYRFVIDMATIKA